MTQHILFDAAGLKLAVPASLVKAVHEHLPVQSIEGTQSWFLGLAIADGRLLPVTDLGAFCGIRACSGRTMELDPDLIVAGIKVDDITGLSDEHPVVAETDTQQSSTSGGSLTFTGELIPSLSHNHRILDMQALVLSPAFVNIRE